MTVADRDLVDGASFDVHAGDKVGLVGRNGAGKTTLLRALSGARRPNDGTGGRDRSRSASSPRIPGSTPAASTSSGLAYVLSSRGLDAQQRELETLRAAMEDDHSERSIARYSRAEEQFRADGGYRAESDVHRILAGLGLAADRATLPLGVLSGGERRRVELARILFGGTDNLILDEPTNHLDVDAKEWLMGFLRAYRGALLVVSHDLELLDQAITRVLHLDDGDLREYKGTYSQYLDRAGEGRGAAGEARGAPGGGDRAAVHPRRQDAPLEREARADREEPRQARRPPRRAGGHADPAGPQRALPLPRAAALRTRRARRAEGLAKSFGTAPSGTDVGVRAPAG